MKTAQKLNFANNVAANLSFGVIYSAHLEPSLKLLMDNPVLLLSLRCYLFPFIVLTDVIRTTLSWHQAKKEKYQTRFLIRALHDTVATAVAATAVILGFTIGTIYSTLSPTIFTILLAVNSLVHLSSSLYYAAKGNNTTARNDHFVAALVLGLSAASLGALTFVGNALFALIGLAAASIGVAHAIYKGYQDYQAQKVPAAPQEKVLAKVKSSNVNNPRLRVIHSRPRDLNPRFSKYSGSVVNGLARHSGEGRNPGTQAVVVQIPLDPGLKHAGMTVKGRSRG